MKNLSTFRIDIKHVKKRELVMKVVIRVKIKAAFRGVIP